MVAANAFQIIDRLNSVVFVEESDTLRAQTLDFEQLKSGGRIFCEHLVATVERTTLTDFGKHKSDAFADTGDISNLLFRVTDDVDDSLRIAGDHGGGIAIAANTESVLSSYLHKVSGFVEQSRNLFIFHGHVRTEQHGCKGPAKVTAQHGREHPPPRVRFP